MAPGVVVFGATLGDVSVTEERSVDLRTVIQVIVDDVSSLPSSLHRRARHRQLP